MKANEIKIGGVSLKYFVPFFIIIVIATYGGFLPTTTFKDANGFTYEATTYIGTMAYLMSVGGILFFLGNIIPIVNKYLGGAVLLPMLGTSLLNYLGFVPEILKNGVKILMSGGFQDFYIATLLVGSILIMDRKILLGATVRYMPTVIGSQFFALLFASIAGLITGYGWKEGLFYVAIPTMSGGSAGAISTIPSLYSNLSGTDMMGMAGIFISYVSISNVVAIIVAAVFGPLTEKKAGWNGAGRVMLSQTEEMDVEEEKRPGTSANYKALGGGILIALTLYLAGSILGQLPGTGILAGLAWTIILAIIIKAANLLSTEANDQAVYAMNFSLQALLPMLIAGIGINSFKITDLATYFSWQVFIVIIIGVLGAFFGAAIIGRLSGLFPYEAGVTAGLCCCNIGGSGDIATLTAANRMNLLAFASISTRIGGALMIIWAGFLYRAFML